MIWGIRIGYWQGWQDSNLRYTGSKPDALPLGYSPLISLSLKTGAYYPCIHLKFKQYLKTLLKKSYTLANVFFYSNSSCLIKPCNSLLFKNFC